MKIINIKYFYKYIFGSSNNNTEKEEIKLIFDGTFYTIIIVSLNKFINIFLVELFNPNNKSIFNGSSNIFSNKTLY